jgi:thermitase
MIDMMMTIMSVCVLLALTALWFVVWGGKPKADKDYIAKELLVKFKPDVSESRKAELIQRHKCKVVHSCAPIGFDLLRGKSATYKLMKKFNELEEVEYCEPNYLIEAFYTPNDTFYATYQYGPQKVQAPSAWDVTQSSSSVVIAIVDSGIQLNHPDLASKLVQGYDFVDGDNVPDDGNGHGTHVAGIAAAVTNNALGIAGMAPLAKLMPVRVLNNSNSGTLANVASGIVFATDNGAKVINLSLGSTVGTTTLEQAVNYAWNNGAVVVASAGNSGVTTPNYPAYYTNAIAVASTDQLDQKSSFSNYGTWVDVAAPGSSILSTYLGGNYAYMSGTSMSAPHVSGLAALLAAQGRNQLQIRTAIETTCDPIPGTGTYWVYGRINADRAVRS